jgi:hypothetical protein
MLVLPINILYKTHSQTPIAECSEFDRTKVKNLHMFFEFRKQTPMLYGEGLNFPNGACSEPVLQPGVGVK